MADYLFTKDDLYHLLEHHKSQIKKEVDELDQNYILRASESDLAQHLIDKFHLDPPRLLKDSIYVDEPHEIDIDVSGDPRYDFGFSHRGRPSVKGIRVTIHVPYEGEAELFRWKPSTFTLSFPHAQIANDELLLVYDILSSDQERLQQRYQQDVNNIDQNLQSVRSQVEECAKQIPGIVSAAISSRKERLRQSMGFVGNLGLPVRRSSEQTIAVSLPKVRRPSPAPLPKVSPSSYQPEPTIVDSEYDYILKVLENLTIAIERSPSVFTGWGEERLRDYILIQLNGHYEGQATGETFNRGGKTDILVRVGGKNVFIGECKFWKSKKAYLQALDQLFGYTCWSDTKAAVILFNRTGDHTRVIETIKAETPGHPRFKKELQHRSETHLRYIFRHLEDGNRDIYVAVLAINLPQAISNFSNTGDT